LETPENVGSMDEVRGRAIEVAYTRRCGEKMMSLCNTKEPILLHRELTVADA